MKYGLILHNYGKRSSQAVGFNIGDPIQTIALEQLYKEIGIPIEKIKYLNLCDLKNYDGEYVILPILSVAIGVGFLPLPLSPKIIPIFFSSHFVINELSQEMVAYLNNYAPIGCRDEYSLYTMRKYNIPAFLSGCITVTFDKRSEDIYAKEVYLIDTPNAIEKYLPKVIKDNAIRETHLLPLKNDNEMDEAEAFELLEISRKQLEKYKKTAKLVITSRMHALVPCMAMGIPVIGVFDNLSYRFSWVDKYIPLYTEEKFNMINWKPEVIEFEEQKRCIKKLFFKILREKYDKYASLYEISDFYENRKRSLYGNKYYEAIKKADIQKDVFEYIIWGCGLIGNNVYNIMNKLYPKAKLRVAVDEYAEGFWHNVKIIKSKELEYYKDCFVILATYSGREQGYDVMKKLKKEEFKDFIYLGTING